MKNFLLFAGMLALMTACGQSVSDTEVITNVSVAEANALEVQDMVWVDVRTPEEFQAGHKAGAVNIDWHDPAFEKKLSELVAKETPVMVYCQAGGRSAKAVAKMEQLGYAKIYHMHQGYRAYKHPAADD